MLYLKKEFLTIVDPWNFDVVDLQIPLLIRELRKKNIIQRENTLLSSIIAAKWLSSDTSNAINTEKMTIIAEIFQYSS